MEVIEIPIEKLKMAPWNPNKMDTKMQAYLKTSLTSFGLVQNLVVRPLGDGSYEVLSGNQRLSVLKEMGMKTAPCFVRELDDSHARLLTQALNRVQGEDDLGLKAESMKKILESLSQQEVMEILPDSFASLNALQTLNTDNIADRLMNWESNRHARLKHMGFQLTLDQQQVVQQALNLMTPKAKASNSESPNINGTALYLICKDFIENKGE
jgi:ParB family chromosome partitioning protein